MLHQSEVMPLVTNTSACLQIEQRCPTECILIPMLLNQFLRNSRDITQEPKQQEQRWKEKGVRGTRDNLVWKWRRELARGGGSPLSSGRSKATIKLRCPVRGRRFRTGSLFRNHSRWPRGRSQWCTGDSASAWNLGIRFGSVLEFRLVVVLRQRLLLLLLLLLLL